MKLLIVDDSSAVYGRLLGMLGGVRYLTAAVARSLREVMEKGRQLCPDAVVLDVRLPDGNGLDALSSIKENSPGSRVHMYTSQVEFRGKALHAGADGLFDKSLEFKALAARLLGTDSVSAPGGGR